MTYQKLFCSGSACLIVLSVCAAATAAEPAPSFERDIAPLLTARCLKCHSGSRPKGDLDLSRRANLLAGGASGAVVTPGKASESLLFAYVRDKKMPPKQSLADKEIDLLRRWIDGGAAWSGSDLIPPRTNDAKRAGRDWWSLQPIRRPALPAISTRGWVRSPIDAFILDRLGRHGLAPAAEVDRRTYIRRVTLDLTGLLPTPEEIDAFVGDSSATAYEKMVDRLLASPAYGERWARHWLDVVRFAESHGYEMNTLRPGAWPYRDYAIRAFNRDIPYPQFVREQLAGDAFEGDALQKAATGFLVAGPHDMVGNATPEGQLQQRMDDLFDMVSTTGTTFLGLTVGCARCHDHKFDPIAQKDFYSLQAVFAGVEHAEREIRLPADGERSLAIAQLRKERDKLDRQLDSLEPLAGPPGSTPMRSPVHPERNVERFAPIEVRCVRFTVLATTDNIEPCIDELEVYGPDAKAGNLALASHGARATASSVYPNNPRHRLEHINDGRYSNERSWISREPGRGWVQIDLPRPAVVERIVWGRDRARQYRDRLPRDYRIEISADGHAWKTVAGSWDRHPPGHAVTAPEEVSRLNDERRRLDKQLSELQKPQRIYAGTFRTPDRTHVLKRGDPMQKLQEVQPAAPAQFGPRFALNSGAREAERRLALAAWIAHPDNPLPARVMVNRLWHWHFGQGLVRTPSDFGFNGDRPSHPELLDWLAKEYQENGWRLKPLHRLIVLSNTYRQASRFDAKAAAVDADNRLLWRYPPRRLEAESIRDTMLQVSGALQRRMAGPGYHLWDYSGYVIVFSPKARLEPDAFRRMIYQFKPRLQQDGTFGVFDCPDATTTMPRRNRSTTALQALNLLNDPFVLDQSERFAARLRLEAGSDPAAQINRAFRLAFGREPSAVEASAAAKLVRDHGLAVFCRALFNANEFVFVN